MGEGVALTEARSARRELDSGKLPPLVVAPDGAGPGGPSYKEGVELSKTEG
jgi:hypothetical protein